MESYVSKLLSSGSINRICESRMIRVQLRTIRKDLICKTVKLGNVHWEPGNIIIRISCSEHFYRIDYSGCLQLRQGYLKGVQMYFSQYMC